jgi:hypothetical protein
MFSWSTSQLFGPLTWLATLVALLGFMPARAQQAPAKLAISLPYDFQSEMKIKGTVADIKLIGAGANTKVARLVVTTGAESIEVLLCPKSFLDDMGVSFSKGDEVEITGSRVRDDDLDEMLAREVVKGNDTVVLRDKQGKPVWN